MFVSHSLEPHSGTVPSPQESRHVLLGKDWKQPFHPLPFGRVAVVLACAQLYQVAQASIQLSWSHRVILFSPCQQLVSGWFRNGHVTYFQQMRHEGRSAGKGLLTEIGDTWKKLSFFLSDHEAGNLSCQPVTMRGAGLWEERYMLRMAETREWKNLGPWLYHGTTALTHQTTTLPGSLLLDQVIDFTCCLDSLICSLHLEAS